MLFHGSSKGKPRHWAKLVTGFPAPLRYEGDAAAGTKPAARSHRVLSALGGIALAFAIGGGLVIAAALTR